MNGLGPEKGFAAHPNSQGATLEQARDVRVAQARQQLALSLETAAHMGSGSSTAHDLERELPSHPHAPGTMDDTGPAAAELSEQLEGPQPLRNAPALRLRNRLEEVIALRVMSQELIDLRTYPLAPRRLLIEPGRSQLGRALEGPHEELPQALVARGIHSAHP